MSKVIGKEPLIKAYHQMTCNKCNSIIGFDNSDIIRDDMGCEICCPNCGNWIKF